MGQSLGKLHHNYRGTARWAIGPELYGVLRELATYGAKKANAAIAKQTGQLAASANPSVTPYAGETLTAWTGHVETEAVHPWSPGKSYAAAHEFGWIDKHGQHHPGGHELRYVLRSL